METTCAVCRLTDGEVINLIIASPGDNAPDGCRLVEVMVGQACDIGAVWDGVTFMLPAVPNGD